MCNRQTPSVIAICLSRRLTALNVVALMNLVLLGCTNFSLISSNNGEHLSEIAVTATRKEIPGAIANILGKPDDLWGRIAWGFSWERDHSGVKPEIEHILAQPNFFEVLSERALPALPWIVSEIERLDLPMELALIPVIESMLDPWAYSSQRAAGLWQISPATASHYGLEVNWWYDARLDIPVATEFALGYLVELQTEFNGDWALALAAYNSGRGRVARALKSAGNTHTPADYWNIKLPRETRRYVPRILALAEIISHPARFNMSLPHLNSAVNHTMVSTDGQIEMARVAELAGVELGVLRATNPAQLRWATAPDVATTLWLPSESVDKFSRGLAQITPSERVSWAHYTVASGDTLGAIAKRFNTQVALISSANALTGSLIRSGQTLLIPRGTNSEAKLAAGPREWPPKRRGHAKYHKVQSGDSLWSIAQRYGTSVIQLASINRLDPTAYLQLGQRLKLR